jgi:hypothetical protein
VKAKSFIKSEPSVSGLTKRARAAFRELSVPKKNIIIRMQARAMIGSVKEDEADDRTGANADALRQAD